MDGLIEKKLVRKEIIRDLDAFHSEIEKWGLLSAGETMAQCCAEFERAVRTLIPVEEMRTNVPGKSMNVVLCMDSREDVHYLERIRLNCQDNNVPFLEKELPAGDYVFLEESLNEMVPIVIERKSWSDLADSCLGKGRAKNRLDCVQLNLGSSLSMSCAGNCQLCKMKRCGCTQILFIIEGERCHGAQRNERCTVTNCCSACKLLSERHKITQTELEIVLTRLQLEHGSYIHYTKSFNDTIASLFAIRSLIQKNVSFASRVLEQENGNAELLFELYKSNSRGCNHSTSHCSRLPLLHAIHEWDAQAVISVIQSSQWDLSILQTLLGSKQTDQRSKKRAKCAPNETISIDSDSDDSSVKIITKPDDGRKQPETICLDSDSDDSIIEVTAENNPIIILDGKSKASSKPIARRKAKKRKAHHISSQLSIKTEPAGNITGSILIIHRLNQYESQYGKSLEKVWRETYLESNGELALFYDRSLEKLTESMKSTSFPCVHGRTLAAFSLWMQLINGVQVRFVQGEDVVSEIRINSSGGSMSSTTTSTCPAIGLSGASSSAVVI
jgi:ERCC4-type nuclease